MSITMAVIASDIEYVTRMLSYMKASPIYHTWQLHLYSHAERLQHLSELERADLIVIEEALLPSFLARVEDWGSQRDDIGCTSGKGRIPMVVLVAERRELQQQELYKFQPVSSLLLQLQQRYEQRRNSQANPMQRLKSTPRTIAISSTLEQCGKTIMALHMAAVLASKGFRVFYCNFELWNTSEAMLPQLRNQGSASYSDLLYIVKSNVHQASAWLAKHVLTEPSSRIQTLRAFQHEADRSMLSAEDANELLSTIASSGLYDYVIVDMPAGLNGWTIPVLAQCDLHYMLMLSHPSWQEKHRMVTTFVEQQYEELLSQVNEKRCYVLIEANHSNHNEIKVWLHERLPYVEAWSANIPVLLSAVSYRAAIERCVQHLLCAGEKAG